MKKGFVLIFILISALTVGVLLIVYLTSNYKIEKVPYLQVSTPTPTINPDLPYISTPAPRDKVTSPLVVRGTVPAGWMFEGVFPIKLLDDNRNLIVQEQAKETVPGTWQSGNSVDFEATINFTTSTNSGFLVLENDNPSGLPENSKTFEIPILFSGNVSQECGVCGPQGVHNIEGNECASGLVCKKGLTTTASYCVKEKESVAKCEGS